MHLHDIFLSEDNKKINVNICIDMCVYVIDLILVVRTLELYLFNRSYAIIDHVDVTINMFKCR